MSWLMSQALMNSHSLQEQVAEYLGENFSDGEQSAPLNGNHIQQAYCAPDKMTDFSRISRFGMTFKPLTESRGEELLTLYLAGFHAKTLAQQEKAQELTENDQECGEKWRASFTKYDPDMRLWKTHQCSLLGDLEPFLETWPQWGLMRGGECWEQRTLEQTIRGTESGLSPNGVDSFHTPNTTGLDGGSNSRKALKKRQENWPTPRSCSAMAATITPESAWSEKRNPNLETIVGKRMFPTPTCHNSKEGAYPSEYNRKTPTLATHAGGKLNPDWVEWLMNWPIKWSDLNGFDEKEYKRWQEASATPIQESWQMRTVWWDRDPSQASHRQQHKQQQEQQHSNSLQQVSRGASCEPTMEGSHKGQDLPILRESIYIQTSERENLQSGVREQTCMDETQIIPRIIGKGIANVDRLKAIGNGQVPLCAATAWRILSK
jgi:DNA (cytosine-5)-methyltransferase 1